MDKIRIDKWLWTVRIFKSRTQATAACKTGKVKLDEINVKPSSNVEVGNIVQVKKSGFNLTFEVLKILKNRVGAPIAISAYNNLTSEAELNKYADWYVGKARPAYRDKGTGRPTKRDRRDLDKFKTDFF